MDNVTPLEPAAPLGQAAAQPGAPIPTPGASVPETPAPPSGQAPKSEELILGKFKSQADLEAAYKNLESHAKRVEMDKADLEKLLINDAPSSPAATPEQPDTTEELRKALTPVVNELLSPAIARIEIRDMVDKYGTDFVKAAPQVAELRKAKPHLSLEDAYRISAYEQKAVPQAAPPAAAQKAQVETSQPSGVRPLSLEEAASDPRVPFHDVLAAAGPEYENAFGKYINPKKRTF